MTPNEEYNLRQNLYRQTKLLINRDKRRKQLRYQLAAVAVIALAIGFWWNFSPSPISRPVLVERIKQEPPPVLSNTLGLDMDEDSLRQAINRAYLEANYSLVIELSNSVLGKGENRKQNDDRLLLIYGYALARMDSIAISSEVLGKISKRSVYRQPADFYAAIFNLGKDMEHSESIECLCRIAKNEYHKYAESATQILSYLPSPPCLLK